MFKQDVINAIVKNGGFKQDEIEKLIERPPSYDLGDYAFPCFTFAKALKKSPQIIAQELSEKIIKTNSKEFEKVEAKSGYLNFFFNKKYFAENVLKEISKTKQDFAKSNLGKGKTIAIDLSSPNIAKPFGIGHLRSTIIGNSVSNICKKNGYKVVKINYLGDWGTQFGKLIVGFKKFGNEPELKKDPIKHLLEIYVKVNADPALEDDARKAFKELEDGNKEHLALWKRFRELSLEEFNKLYKLIGIEFDDYTGESYYNDKMDVIVQELQKKGLLEESEDAQVVNLEKYKLGVALIKKSDGATLYITRDITAAIDRFKKYKFSRMFYDVGQEQQLHFKQLFKILELMGYDFSKECVHIVHGLYLDKDGKKFATRKGKTVFMEDVLQETIDLAKKTIEEKNPALKNKEEIARKVAIAAIFYGDLKNNRVGDIVFDIERFLDFQGDTGPYLQYSYARASSILRKANYKESKIEIKELENAELNLIRKLAEYENVVQRAYQTLSPNFVAGYSSELAQAFNEFYHACPVIGSSNEKLRLQLIDSFRIVMKDSLSLLGIDVVEEM